MCTVLYVYTLRIYTDMFQLILILLMVQKSQTTTWDWKKKKVVNNGIFTTNKNWLAGRISEPSTVPLRNQTWSKCRVILRDFPLNNALFGLVLLVEEIRLASWGW